MALRRNRPPQHRIDAPIVYVHQDDDAWNIERVREEQKRMAAAGEDQKHHPVALYQGGWTRYDLNAKGTVLGDVVAVSDYLDEGKHPMRWVLRRLTVTEWYEVHALFERAARMGEQPYACYLRCFALGVTRLEGGPSLEMTGGRLTMADMEVIRDMADGTADLAEGRPPIDFPFDVGTAVYNASSPLTDPEKKVSGSAPGPQP